MHQWVYPIRLIKDAGGGFVVQCRDLPEAITQGDNRESALEAAEGALQAAIEARITDREAIPLPSRPQSGEVSIALPLTTAMKAMVYWAMREKNINQSALARALDINEKEVRRMLDPDHPSKATTLEQALHHLGKRVVVGIESTD